MLQRDDADLADLVPADLADAARRRPTRRWTRGCPLGRRRCRSTPSATWTGSPGTRAVAAHPGLAVAGAAYDGVGIPACIAAGRPPARCSPPGPRDMSGRTTDPRAQGAPRAQRVDPLHDVVGVPRRATPCRPTATRSAAEADELFEQLAAKDVVVRGIYDVAGCAPTPTS